MTFHPAFWWALAGIVLMICEFAAPGLILFFFGLGALLTALISWIFPLSLELQLTVFIATSLASLFGLRRFLKPIFTGHASGDDNSGEVNTLVGFCGEVTTAIEPGKTGRILLNGATWKAQADERLPEGTPVEIIGQKSLTLLVKRKKI